MEPNPTRCTNLLLNRERMRASPPTLRNCASLPSPLGKNTERNSPSERNEDHENAYRSA